MKTALVTGANKGIGLAVVKQLAEKGFYVYMGCRDLQKGIEAVNQLQAGGLSNIEPLQIDVTDQLSVNAAGALLGTNIKSLDVLINNAGISGVFGQSALDTPAEEYQKVYDTNVFGVIRATKAFIDLMHASDSPRIVNVSTAMASLTMAGDITNDNYPQRYVVYQSSKAALNMYTVNLAYELRNTSFKVNAICPGYTQTDFTGGNGTSTTDEAAQRIIKFALIGEDGPTGKFYSEEYLQGSVYPW